MCIGPPELPVPFLVRSSRKKDGKAERFRGPLCCQFRKQDLELSRTGGVRRSCAISRRDPPIEKRGPGGSRSPGSRPTGDDVRDKTHGAKLYRNTVSYVGGLIAVAGIVLMALSFVFDLGAARPNPYIGIFTYVIAPAFLLAGLVVFLYGLRRESRRRRRVGSEEALPYPRVDLNDPRQRRICTLVVAGGALMAMLLAFTSYKAYLFTDSTTFCGKVCHRVMQPEYTAYLSGPHARVACVNCHVGPGVPWYVKSKISGIPQVFAVLFDTYPRPIPVPIRNLRPAREICEECHWPQKFYGAQLMQYPHFRYDEKNTPEQISLLVRTGGGTPNLGENAGIHWHMVIDNKIGFKATDRQQERIPWVRAEHRDGSVEVYEDTRVSREKPDGLPVRSMDCMDCHNRPSHVFLPPETAVDKAMEGGNISPDLPWIKKIAVDALTKGYRAGQDVHRAIREPIEAYYARNYPGGGDRKASVDSAIATITRIYGQNVFPSMNVDWKTYPNHIGHRNWPGCFRCHDGFHRTSSGKTLTSACSVCHTAPQRGRLLPLGAAPMVSSEPWHPFPLNGKHGRILCNLCHQAGYRPVDNCVSCHGLSASAPMMSGGCNICHLEEGEAKPLADCSSCHRAPAGLHRTAGHKAAECTACHAPHLWKVIARKTCLSCHGDKKDHNAPAFCGDCHEFR